MPKLWKNLPIVKKLTAVMIIIIAAFCLITFAGQFAFFEKYYTGVKINEASRAATELSELYAADADEEAMYTGIAELAEKYDCYLTVVGADGAMEYTASYIMTVRCDDDSVVRFNIDNAAMSKDFRKLSVAEGDRVTVEYLSENEPIAPRTFFPVAISKGDAEWKMWRREPSYDMHRPIGRQMSATGTVTNIVLPTQQSRGMNAERASAMKAVGEWMSGRAPIAGEIGDKKVHYCFVDDETSREFAVSVCGFGSEGAVVFALTPLATVSEAAVVLRFIFSVWCVIALLAASVIGIIFAKLLTRPVVEITEITKSMAALDFSRSCGYEANDEIGELAKNINILSENLDNAVCRLKEANSRLMDDIERERNIEKSRREFVAAASHELKTPLGIIRAYTEAIADGISENKRKHYSEVIINETERMDRLILDMLDNTKFESGGQVPNVETHDIGRLTKEVYARFDDVLSRKGISGSAETEGDTVCKFDIDMIERVITNFIANAEAHTPEGGRIICRAERDGDRVCVSVENSGSHIADEDIEKLWDRFYKADRSRQRSGGGTGLGLAIAKNILNLHKARYKVRNTDLGVKFSFWL